MDSSANTCQILFVLPPCSGAKVISGDVAKLLFIILKISFYKLD
jgi:hypothetical protein